MKSQYGLWFAVLAVCSFVGHAEADIDVKSHLDRESSGWAYKTWDYAFSADKDDCHIQWNAVEDKDGKRSLAVRRKCKLGFSGQIPLHRAILKAIDQRWPLRSFKSIDWGPLCAEGDWAWCEPIAKASLKSRDFIDYYRHYPHSKLKGLNGLFVEIANSTDAYARFAGLMREFGVTIRLGGVEKVFALRVNESPFAEILKTATPDKKARVMYNAGMAYFSIMD